MVIKSLSEVAFIDISGVDKKFNENETEVKLCNFTDVYYNWAISKDNVNNFMIASANKDEIRRFLLKKGSVAITKDSETRDDIGIACYIADDLDNTLLGYHCALIVPKTGILYGKYLNAYLHTKMARTYFSNQASGSGQRYTLTIGAIGDVKIPMIPYEEQVKIGNIFSLIDRKIVNNNKINVELESMSKTLYDYWFLQFEFPNENGKPYKSSGGKMVWNEELKREIPEGWEVRTVKDCADVVSGYPFKTETYSKDGKYKIYTIGNVQDGYIDDTCPNKIDFIPDDMDRGCILKPCDIIMSLTGNVGRVGLVYTKNALLNQRVLKVEPLEGYHNFLYLLFRNSSFSRVMQRIASGTSQKNLSPNQVCDFKFAIPKKSLMVL